MKLSIELEISKNHIAEQENTISLLEIKCKELEKLLKMKNQSINELEELNDLSKNQLNEYSSALAFHIGQAEKLKRNCQMFRLNRIGNLGSFLVVPTLLIIRRDLDGNYIIELEDNYSKIVLDAKDIIELSLCKENINKFRLIYKIPVIFLINFHLTS